MCRLKLAHLNRPANMRSHFAVLFVAVSMATVSHAQTTFTFGSVEIRMTSDDWAFEESRDDDRPWIFEKSETLGHFRRGDLLSHISVSRFFGACSTVAEALQITRNQFGRECRVEKCERQIGGMGYSSLKATTLEPDSLVDECVFVQGRNEVIMISVTAKRREDIDAFLGRILAGIKTEPNQQR